MSEAEDLPELNKGELDRYARHIVLRDIGGIGQRKLKAARVLVVGAGGLGASCLAYLAAAGVGHIGVIDHDQVSLDNLQRQILFTTNDVGQPKTQRIKARLEQLNPEISVDIHNLRLDLKNVAQLLPRYDIIADGCDNFATRLLVGDYCRQSRLPLVSAAVGSFDGQLLVLNHLSSKDPCYRCFVGDNPEQPLGNCSDQGILGVITGVMGSLQALEIIRLICNFGSNREGILLLYSALDSTMRSLTLSKNPGCRH